jgi:hypothetical protein
MEPGVIFARRIGLNCGAVLNNLQALAQCVELWSEFHSWRLSCHVMLHPLPSEMSCRLPRRCVQEKSARDDVGPRYHNQILIQIQSCATVCCMCYFHFNMYCKFVPNVLAKNCIYIHTYAVYFSTVTEVGAIHVRTPSECVESGDLLGLRVRLRMYGAFST